MKGRKPDTLELWVKLPDRATREGRVPWENGHLRPETSQGVSAAIWTPTSDLAWLQPRDANSESKKSWTAIKQRGSFLPHAVYMTLRRGGAHAGRQHISSCKCKLVHNVFRTKLFQIVHDLINESSTGFLCLLVSKNYLRKAPSVSFGLPREGQPPWFHRAMPYPLSLSSTYEESV